MNVLIAVTNIVLTEIMTINTMKKTMIDIAIEVVVVIAEIETTKDIAGAVETEIVIMMIDITETANQVVLTVNMIQINTMTKKNLVDEKKIKKQTKKRNVLLNLAKN